jgi:hypothetical protein
MIFAYYVLIFIQISLGFFSSSDKERMSYPNRYPDAAVFSSWFHTIEVSLRSVFKCFSIINCRKNTHI